MNIGVNENAVSLTEILEYMRLMLLYYLISHLKKIICFKISSFFIFKYWIYCRKNINTILSKLMSAKLNNVKSLSTLSKIPIVLM